MTTRKRAVLAALTLLLVAAGLGVARLGPLTKSIPTPKEGRVTVSRDAAVTAAAVGLPASFAGYKQVAGYRYEAKDAKGRPICSLAHVEMVAPKPAAEVAAAVRQARKAAVSSGKVTTLWWGTRQDAVVVTLTPKGKSGTLVVAERAVRKRQGPRLPGEK